LKILFVIPNGFYARNFASVIDALGHSRHKIVIGLEKDENASDDAPTAAKAVLHSYIKRAKNRVEVVHLPERESRVWRQAGRQVAALWDYSRYALPLHRHAHRCAARAKAVLVPPMHVFSFLVEALGTRAARSIARICSWLYAILPPDPSIRRSLLDHDPDVVLITPLIDLGSDQADYVKACRQLRIPVGHCVASWDNLTNKGLIKALPDRVFVWNEAQEAEAVTLHGVPQDRIIVTGAQIFDHWFTTKPSRNRAEFCAVASLDPSKLILLYTASSVFICRNEVDFVLEWLGALRGSDDARLRDVGILIRPHPKATKTMSQWNHVALKQFKNVVVFPQGDRLSLAKDSEADYYDSLYHAAAVVGINTSAMLEASIVGRRPFTILRDEVRGGQDGMVHFQHLTRNQFLGVAPNLEEHICQLGKELDGTADRTSGFVNSFLRPYGLDQPATPIFVAEVEEMEDLAVEGPSLSAWLGWIQRPFLLPLIALISLSTVLTKALSKAWRAGRFLVGVALRRTGLIAPKPVLGCVQSDASSLPGKPKSEAKQSAELNAA